MTDTAYCTGCGIQIDAIAATCPLCGAPQAAVVPIMATPRSQANRGFPWVWIGFLLFAFIAVALAALVAVPAYKHYREKATAMVPTQSAARTRVSGSYAFRTDPETEDMLGRQICFEPDEGSKKLLVGREWFCFGDLNAAARMLQLDIRPTSANCGFEGVAIVDISNYVPFLEASDAGNDVATLLSVITKSSPQPIACPKLAPAPEGGVVGMSAETQEGEPLAVFAGSDTFPASPVGEYVVSFGSYATTADAGQVVAALRNAGLPAFSEATKLGDRDVQRVRIGPFADRAIAEAAHLAAGNVSGGVDARVVVLENAAVSDSLNMTPRASASSNEDPEIRAKHLANYVAAVQSAILRQWTRPETVRIDQECQVLIRQIPGGEVVSLQPSPSCPFDERGRRSVEAAVLKASPLPYVGYEDIFASSLVIRFRAED